MNTGNDEYRAADAQNYDPKPETDDLPAYEPSKSGESPSYEAIQKALTNLQRGDPDETISVPMVHRKDSSSIHRLNPFSRKGYESTPHYITARKMKRSQYLAHYAKKLRGYLHRHGQSCARCWACFRSWTGNARRFVKAG